MSGSIDITDLVRGDGEWKNMQEVVRKTFKLFFEHMERQNEQIANLTTQMAVMQRDLARVPTIKDVDKAIEMKVKYSRKSPSSDELDKITSAIYNIKSDMERKASIRYVDETMRKKMDKSDAVALQLSQIAASKYTDDIAKIKRDLMDDKVRSEGLARSTFEIQEQVKSLQLYQESKSWKPQVDNLYDMMTRFYDKDQINMLLDNKVSHGDLDKALATNTRTAQINSTLLRMEKAMGDHEKFITSIRIRLNDETLFNDDALMRSTTLTEETSDSCRRVKWSKKSSSGYESDGRQEMTEETKGQSVKSDKVALSIKEGRLDAIVSELWRKMILVKTDTDNTKKAITDYNKRFNNIDHALSVAARVGEIETLAAIIEEQKLRIDSLIHGSTTIEPLSRELVRIDKQLQEISSHLSLPQPKSLHSQLEEFGSLVDVLSSRVAELGTALGRASIRLESNDSSLSQLDSRLHLMETTAENFKHQIDYLDVKGSAYDSMKDVANSLQELWFLVADGNGRNLHDKGEAKSLLKRMENLEESQSNSFELIDSNIKKVSDLKELVISLTSSPVKAPKPPQGEDEVSRPKQSTRNQEMKSKQISSNELLDQYISEEGGQKKPLLNEIATDTATGSIDTSDMLSYTTESMSDLEIIPTTNNQQGYSDRPTYDQMRSETGAISSNRDNSNRNNYYSSANDAGNSNWLDKMRNGDRYAERRKVTVPPVNKPVKKSSTNLNALKSKLALTSIDKVDERLEALKREKELLRMKLRTRIEDSIH